MEDLVKAVQKINEEPLTKQFMNWTTHNSSEETDPKKWEQGIKDFSKDNGKDIVKMVEGLGK